MKHETPMKLAGEPAGQLIQMAESPCNHCHTPIAAIQSDCALAALRHNSKPPRKLMDGTPASCRPATSRNVSRLILESATRSDDPPKPSLNRLKQRLLEASDIPFWNVRLLRRSAPRGKLHGPHRVSKVTLDTSGEPTLRMLTRPNQKVGWPVSANCFPLWALPPGTDLGLRLK